METLKIGNLQTAITIQPGAVVSRALVDKKTGTITLFAFDTGEGLSEHTAPYEAFFQVIDGEAEVVVAGEKNILSMGGYIVMPANVPHEVRASKPLKALLIMIRG